MCVFTWQNKKLITLHWFSQQKSFISCHFLKPQSFRTAESEAIGGRRSHLIVWALLLSPPRGTLPGNPAWGGFSLPPQVFSLLLVSSIQNTSSLKASSCSFAHTLIYSVFSIWIHAVRSGAMSIFFTHSSQHPALFLVHKNWGCVCGMNEGKRKGRKRRWKEERRKEGRKGHGAWTLRLENIRGSRGWKMLWVPHVRAPHPTFQPQPWWTAPMHTGSILPQVPTQSFNFSTQGFLGSPEPLLNPPIGTVQRYKGVHAPCGDA